MRQTSSLNFDVLSSSLGGDFCARSGLRERGSFLVIYTADVALAKKHYLAALPKAKLKFETDEMVCLEVESADGVTSLVLQTVAPQSPFGKLIGKQSIGMTMTPRMLKARAQSLNLIDMTKTLGWDQKVLGLKDPEGNVMLLVEAASAK